MGKVKQNLGELMKEKRKERGLTLKKVAEKTGFSISFLSQLERGKSSATLQSLKTISRALQVNPGIFFEEETKGKARQERFQELAENEHAFTYEDLAQEMAQPAFNPLRIMLRPGDDGGELFAHDGQEFLYVLTGELTVKIEDETFVLQPNESIMFDTSRPHYWYNYTNDLVTFLCVNYDV